VLDTVRRERLLLEQRNDNLLLRWCGGWNMDDPIWAPSTFSKNRERLREGDGAHAFLDQVLAQAREHDLRSDAHFTVDGTLMEAWAGPKSFQRTATESPSPPDDPGTPRLDFRGERRTHAMPASTTAPEARLYTTANGQEAKLAYRGPGLMEHRHGLGVLGVYPCVTQATGIAEREAALARVEAIPGRHRITLGADKHDDTRDVVRELRERQGTPHVAPQTTGRSSAMDGRTTQHPGDAISQRTRQQVEDICGWLHTLGWGRNVRHRGVARVGWRFTCAAAVYNLVRMRTLAVVA
jgi:hypothetical protein